MMIKIMNATNERETFILQFGEEPQTVLIVNYEDIKTLHKSLQEVMGIMDTRKCSHTQKCTPYCSCECGHPGVKK